MEEFVEFQEKALKHVRIADHMLTMTYPLVKDPKILVAVLENIQGAILTSMTCVLSYERLFKRIPPYTDSFENKFSLFKTKIVPAYSIPLTRVRFISEVRELIDEHKKATTEFSRKGSYVMADSNYQIKTLDEKKLKKFLAQTKELVHELLQLVRKNDAMFRRR